MVLDYSESVEVVAREADATSYPNYPSDRDFQRTVPRLLSHFRELSGIVPSSWCGFLEKAQGDHDLSAFLKSRMDLFNSIEALTISPEEKSRKRLLSEWLGSICYVCRTPTELVRNEVGPGSQTPHIKVRACPSCGWWESENTAFLEVNGLSYDSFTLLRRACLREFAIVDQSAPIDAIRGYLARNPNELNKLSPKKLELLVASVFSDFFQCEAIHVGGPADGGYDLVLLIGQQPALVQVKQRVSSETTEPVASIREFIGAMALSGHGMGFFVSTARRFSRYAKEAAVEAEEFIVDKLELVDASKLVDILKLVSHKCVPWRLYAHSMDEDIQIFQRSQPKLFSF